MNVTRTGGLVLRACAGIGVALVSLACGSSAPVHIDEVPALVPVSRTVVPAPAAFERLQGGGFAVTESTAIHTRPASRENLEVAQFLSDLVHGPDADPRLARAPGTAPPRNAIQLVQDDAASSLGAEGYELTVSPSGIIARAFQPAGLFYAVQTLRQLMPPELEQPNTARRYNFAIAPVRIRDEPRFEWRGAMLDVSRHFLGPADVKRYIDLMALYKLNRLHLHLSDDQGWRIEIKSWPNLTTHGGSTAVGGGAGGFYTQEEYADIVDYARRRYITVVPEIDMPGHTNAALASYAELNCDGKAPALYTGIRVGFSALCPSKEVTWRFIDDVVREISAITSGPYFHIGGDEVTKLSDTQYRAFIERAQSIVQSHGKRMIGWGEIAPARLLPTTIVQHWQPKASPRVAVARGNKVILSPAHKVYLDMKYDATTALGLKWAGYVEVRDSYDWNPATLLEGVGESAILGVEAPLWAETVVTIRDYEYLAFPRLPAVAEVAWSPQARREWQEFRERLASQAPRWTALGVNFYRSPQIPWP